MIHISDASTLLEFLTEEPGGDVLREGRHHLSIINLGKVLTKALGLSFGDRACLTLGRSLSLPILTSDHRMAKAEVGLDIRLVR